MRTWLRRGIGLVALLVGAAAVMAGVGALLPAAHTASVSRVLPAPPDRVWAAVTDVASFPSWRPEVDEVRVRALEGGAPVSWVESGRRGRLPVQVERAEPDRLLVTRIDEGLPFGGTWTYRLQEEGAGTRLTLVEDGVVHDPFFRFVSRFVLGHRGTMERYLDVLAAHLGTGEAGP